MSRPGLTLLETMVALVILGLVVLAGLELMAGTARLSGQADGWARAVVYAEEGLDRALLDPTPGTGTLEPLDDDFVRRTAIEPWTEPGLLRVDVTVSWPAGRFDLSRLVAAP